MRNAHILEQSRKIVKNYLPNKEASSNLTETNRVAEMVDDHKFENMSEKKFISMMHDFFSIDQNLNSDEDNFSEDQAKLNKIIDQITTFAANYIETDATMKQSAMKLLRDEIKKTDNLDHSNIKSTLEEKIENKSVLKNFSDEIFSYLDLYDSNTKTNIKKYIDNKLKTIEERFGHFKAKKTKILLNKINVDDKAENDEYFTTLCDEYIKLLKIDIDIDPSYFDDQNLKNKMFDLIISSIGYKTYESLDVISDKSENSLKYSHDDYYNEDITKKHEYEIHYNKLEKDEFVTKRNIKHINQDFDTERNQAKYSDDYDDSEGEENPDELLNHAVRKNKDVLLTTQGKRSSRVKKKYDFDDQKDDLGKTPNPKYIDQNFDINQIKNLKLNDTIDKNQSNLGKKDTSIIEKPISATYNKHLNVSKENNALGDQKFDDLLKTYQRYDNYSNELEIIGDDYNNIKEEAKYSNESD